jgi:hypothetical protein
VGVQADTVVPEPGNPPRAGYAWRDCRWSQALNRYSYVNNNPLRYTDPSGHYILLEDDPEFAVRVTSGGEPRILRGGRWFRNYYELAWANYFLSGATSAVPPLPAGAFGFTVIGSATNAARALGGHGSGGSAANLVADPLFVAGLAHIVGKATEDALEAAALPAARIGQQVSGAVQKLLPAPGQSSFSQKYPVLRHYTNAREAIAKSGKIRLGEVSGKIWLTPDSYTSAAEAEEALTLDKIPGGYYEIPLGEIKGPLLGPRPVPGGAGLEFVTT